MSAPSATADPGGGAILPRPTPGPGEILVAVDSLVRVPRPRGTWSDRLPHRRPFRKLAFFLWREGVSLTVRKVRAARAHARVQGGRAMVVVRGRTEEGERVVAVGAQPAPEAPFMAFPRELVRVVEVDGADGVDGTDQARRVDHAWDLALTCVADPERFETVFHHSAWSGRPLPEGVSSFLQAPLRTCGDPDHPTAAHPPLLPPEGRMEGPVVTLPGRAAGSGYDLSIVGAGSYPCAYALPVLTGSRATVVDLNPALALDVARRFAFRHATTSVEAMSRMLERHDRPLVLVAGYHSTHVDDAEAILAARPDARILVEKPPATTLEQLDRLLSLRKDHWIEIGYNRRYIPLVQELGERMSARSGPARLDFTVRELALPDEHWYNWPTQGTRITGNLCHWLDLSVFLLGVEPVGHRVTERGPAPGDVRAEVDFADGSTLRVRGTEGGDPLRGVQEWLEAEWDDCQVRIDDFVSVRERVGTVERVRKYRRRDKGHHRMYAALERAMRSEGPPRYPDRDLAWSTRLYLALSEEVAAP